MIKYWLQIFVNNCCVGVLLIGGNMMCTGNSWLLQYLIFYCCKMVLIVCGAYVDFQYYCS